MAYALHTQLHISRSTAALERAIRRDSSPRRVSGASPPSGGSGSPDSGGKPRAGLRVLAPDIDSYLETHFPRGGVGERRTLRD